MGEVIVGTLAATREKAIDTPELFSLQREKNKGSPSRESSCQDRERMVLIRLFQFKAPGYIFGSQWVRRRHCSSQWWCCNSLTNEEGEILFAYHLEETKCEWKTGKPPRLMLRHVRVDFMVGCVLEWNSNPTRITQKPRGLISDLLVFWKLASDDTQSVNMCNPHNAPLMQNRSGSSVVFSLWIAQCTVSWG